MSVVIGKFDLNDWSVANGGPAGLIDHLLQQEQAIPAAPPVPVPQDPLPEEQHGRPVHLATADLNVLAQAMQDRILAINSPPRMFLRDGRVTRLRHRKQGAPRLEPVTNEMMTAHVCDLATWVRPSEKGGYKPGRPPHEIPNMLVHMPDRRLPSIVYVADTPFFDESGTLCETDGYHPGPDCYLHRGGLAYDPIPAAPEQADVDAARALLEDMVCDFPWARPSDRAHFFAALLLPFVRPHFRGSTPIALIEAPSHGAGKGLLADVLSLVITGHAAHATTLGRDEESTEKRLTAIMAEGPAMVVIDNVTDRVLAAASGNLAAAITAEFWNQRNLGTLQMLTLPNRALWIMTGQNPNLTREITRRCIRVRIDPGTDRPEDRTGWKYPDLRGHVTEQRGAIVRACLVLIRRWFALGRPAPCAAPLGSFEAWTRIVGGTLQAAGVDHFLEDRDEMYATADLEGAEWAAFIQDWYDQHLSNPLTAALLLPIASNHLGALLGDGSARSQTSKLGRALVRMRDKYFGTLRLVRAGTDVRPAWVVVPRPAPSQEEPGAAG